jgi:KRAB domain-containing zinc finger protein
MNITNVVKHFHISVVSAFITEHIVERNPMDVINVVKTL